MYKILTAEEYADKICSKLLAADPRTGLYSRNKIVDAFNAGFKEGRKIIKRCPKCGEQLNHVDGCENRDCDYPPF